MSKKLHATLNRLVEQSANNNPRQGRSRKAHKNPIVPAKEGIRIQFESEDDLAAFEDFQDGISESVEFSAAVNVEGKLALFETCQSLQNYLNRRAGQAAQQGKPPPSVTAQVEEEPQFSRFEAVEEEEEIVDISPLTYKKPRASSFSQPETSAETEKAIARFRAERMSDRLRASPSGSTRVFTVRPNKYHLFQLVCQAPNTRNQKKGPRLRFALYAKDPVTKRAVSPFVKLDQSLLAPGQKRTGKRKEEKAKELAAHFAKWSAQNRPITDQTFERFFDKLGKIRLPKLRIVRRTPDGRRTQLVDFDLWGTSENERWGTLLQPTSTEVRNIRKLPDGSIVDLGLQTIYFLVRPGLDIQRSVIDPLTGKPYPRKKERKPFTVLRRGKYVPDKSSWELASRIALGTFLADTGYLGRGDAKLQRFVDPISNVEFHMFMDGLQMVGDALDYDELSSEKDQWFRVGSLMTQEDAQEAELAAEEELEAGDTAALDETADDAIKAEETVAGTATSRPQSGPRGRKDIDND